MAGSSLRLGFPLCRERSASSSWSTKAGVSVLTVFNATILCLE